MNKTKQAFQPVRIHHLPSVNSNQDTEIVEVTNAQIFATLSAFERSLVKTVWAFGETITMGSSIGEVIK
tara:strand:- start:385 stop:591 length:207 start_codon:yes stop_codon:yes gene_type:complete